MSKSLQKRKDGNPVRFVYDAQMPKKMLKFLVRELKLQRDSGHMIPGGRYHNFKDFMKFPKIGPEAPPRSRATTIAAPGNWRS